MRCIINSLILVFLCQGILGQTNGNETLKIIGKSKKLITPDLVTFAFKIDYKDKNQSTAQSQVIKETNNLIARVKEIGFDENDLKLTSLDIDDDWDFIDSKSKKVGYIASIELELTFRYQPSRVSEIIDSIARSNFKYLDYTLKLEVSDSLKNSVRDELIKKSIENAKHSADIIAQSAGISLEGINNIEYKDLVFNYISHGDIPPPPPPAASISRSVRLDLDMKYLSLREMEVYEEVIITWKIKNVR